MKSVNFINKPFSVFSGNVFFVNEVFYDKNVCKFAIHY